MKRDEVEMGEAAVSMELGRLSLPESSFVLPPTPNRERLEGLLYMHLDTARRARMALDSARAWDGSYNSRYCERETALARACDLYRQLQGLAGGVPGDLAEMALYEGLTP
jgi:hypothetical protein